MKSSFAALPALAVAVAPAPTFANPFETKLANGLRIIVKEDRVRRLPCTWSGTAPAAWTKRMAPRALPTSSNT
jgi:hypothetical protein